jgi:hypothetical protein
LPIATSERTQAQGNRESRIAFNSGAKQRLLDKALRIANKAADRVDNQIDSANITQATVKFGVATEKMMLLLGEAAGGNPVQINLRVGAEALHKRYFEMVAEIKELSRQDKDALPNGEML